MVYVGSNPTSCTNINLKKQIIMSQSLEFKIPEEYVFDKK